MLRIIVVSIWSCIIVYLLIPRCKTYFLSGFHLKARIDPYILIDPIFCADNVDGNPQRERKAHFHFTIYVSTAQHTWDPLHHPVLKENKPRRL